MDEMAMARDRRRLEEHPELVRQYEEAGFNRKQAIVLADKIIDRRKPWRREVILVAGLSLLLGAIGWMKTGDVAHEARLAADSATTALNRVEDFTVQLRDSSVSGCRRQNRVRHQQHLVQRILREMLQDENVANRRIRPDDFPGLSHRRFERLVRRSIEDNQEARQALKPELRLTPCEKRYPEASRR